MIQNKSTLVKGSSLAQRARQMALDFLDTALVAVQPQRFIKGALQLKGDFLRLFDNKIRLTNVNGIYVVGAGKATGRMAEAIESLLGDKIRDGLVIVPENITEAYSLSRIRIRGGGHPIPNKASVKTTQELLHLIQQSPENALILCLISGGGSALLSLPAKTISLKDLQQTHSILVKSGAPIEAINTVRKHLSQIKGGQLAVQAFPRPLWTLLISDVTGDQLDVIASGPTVPDSTTFRMAAQVLDDFQLWKQVPSTVHHRIERGITGRIPETPKPGHPAFKHVVNQIIGSNQNACDAILTAAQKKGIYAQILTTDCQGEAREVGAKLGHLAQRLTQEKGTAPCLIIIGSETTVTVRHQGKGGRNSELVTAAMPFLQNQEGLVLASLATDGIDGPTEYAGAIADGASYQRAIKRGLSPEDALKQNTTYQLFAALDDHILTGNTHTNVRDVTVILSLGPNPPSGE